MSHTHLPHLSDWGTAPAADPLSYPGTVTQEPGLLTPDTWQPLTPRAGQRLGAWEASGAALDDLLRTYGEPGIADRHPVLAVGSNGAPAQLRHKFARAQVPGAVPMTPAEVAGVGVGVSAHVGRAGYVPATAVHTPGTTSRLVVCWLTTPQLAAVDATEGAYWRVDLPPDRFPVTLPSGERLPTCAAYVSKHGCLLEDDHPRPLTTQRDLLTKLLAASTALRALLGDTPEEAVARAAADETTRTAARRVFTTEGWVGEQPELEALR
jgi:hypothetical protein